MTDHAARLPEPAHGHTVPAPHHKVNYVAIFLVLVALTVVTVGVAYIDLKSELSKVLLALTIASIKAAAVCLYFMHLKFEGKLIFLILVVPVVFSILLVLSVLPDTAFAPDFYDWIKTSWGHAQTAAH